MSAEKLCRYCERLLPVSEFYLSPAGVPLTGCKRCHNARCARRVRQSPTRKAQQYAAKRAWTERNPVRKRVHEGKTVFLGREAAPRCLVDLELAVMELGQQKGGRA